MPSPISPSSRPAASAMSRRRVMRGWCSLRVRVPRHGCGTARISGAGGRGGGSWIAPRALCHDAAGARASGLLRDIEEARRELRAWQPARLLLAEPAVAPVADVVIDA